MRPPLKTALWAFLSSRLLCALFVYLGHSQRVFLSPVNGGWEGVHSWWLNPWTTYDSQWFISVATSGYQPHTTPFFPLYPFLLKLGSTPGGMAVLGITISNLALLAALYVFFLLTEMDYGRRVAQTGVWLLAFFPTTAFFSAVYTESLFLFLLLLSFYAARKNHWGVAGLCGLLASLTRNPGFLIFFALLIEYFQSGKPVHERSKATLSISLPLLGFLSVQGYFWFKFGSPLAGVSSQKMYYRNPSLPWVPLWKDLVNLFNPHSIEIVTFLNVFFIVLSAVLIASYFRATRKSYLVFLAGIIMMNLCYARIFPPYTASSVRYLSTAFPFTMLLAVLVSDFSSRKSILFLEGGIYLFLCFYFSYLFGLKIFIA